MKTEFDKKAFIMKTVLMTTHVFCHTTHNKEKKAPFTKSYNKRIVNLKS